MNGKEIFENDLISCKNNKPKGNIFKIEWNDFDLCFELKSWYKGTQEWGLPFLIDYKYCKAFDFKYKDIIPIDLDVLIKISEYEKGNRIMECLVIGNTHDCKNIEQWIEAVLYKGE